MGAVEPRPRASAEDLGFPWPGVAGGLTSAPRRKNRRSESVSRPKRRRSRRYGRSDRAIETHRRGRRGALGPGGRRSRLAPSHHSPPLRRQDAGRHEDAGFAGGTAQRVGSEEALEGNDPVRVLVAAQRRGCANSRATAIQILAPPRREDPVVPDADEARGQDVLEEELCELRPAEGAVFGHVSVRPVLVAESDALAVVVDDAGVGDGDAVEVAGEVGGGGIRAAGSRCAGRR